MDSATIGILGGITGTAIGLIGGIFGAYWGLKKFFLVLSSKEISADLRATISSAYLLLILKIEILTVVFVALQSIVSTLRVKDIVSVFIFCVVQTLFLIIYFLLITKFANEGKLLEEKLKLLPSNSENS